MAVLQRYKSTIYGLESDLTALNNKDTALQSDIDAEVLRAQSAESTLQTNIDNEVSRATNAESTLTTDLNAEISRAQSAESTLQTNIDNEVTRATNAESGLQTDIDDEVTRATNAESTLQTNIDNEVTRATNAETALSNDLSDLSGVTDAATARTNLGVYSTSEVDTAINNANLNLGTNLSTTNATTAASDFGPGDLSVGDNIFFTDDGDSKWAIYKVIAITDGAYSTSTLEKIMDEDVYLNAQSASAIKSSYESNADTNAFTDEEQSRVGRIGSSSTTLDTSATTVLAAINELHSDISSGDSALQTQITSVQNELNTTQSSAGLNSSGSYTANSSANYINNATTLKDADNKLDAQIKVNADGLAQEISDRQSDTALSLRKSNNLSDVSSVSSARSNLDVYSTAEVDAVVSSGGAVFITESLLVTSDSITLSHEPKNGVVLNFATVRHTDSNFVSYDIPVTVSANPLVYNLSPDSSGQFDGVSVTIQYAYIPSV
ncbi:hypothetical protein Va1_172 [Vibrio phage Va1]|nr:hypothetical protein Va1_172 [Vibrio phage Va1]